METPILSSAFFLRAALAWLALLFAAGLAHAAPPEGDVTLQGQYWIDTTGLQGIDAVAGGAARLRALDRRQSFSIGNGALWMRYDFTGLDGQRRWRLLLTGAALLNRASLFVRGPDGRWEEQVAGDHTPVAQWHRPHFTPLFTLPQQPGEVWLRLENRPAPVSPFVQLLRAESVERNANWTYLLVGGYVGFCLLVFVVGLMHARLYGDIAFDAYCLYVACMLLFQLSFTGLGGLFLWPGSALFNDWAPSIFMFFMVAAGIWFIREATALKRHSRIVDRAAVGFSLFGALFAFVYAFDPNPTAFAILNVYALASVLLSISLCLWTWRKGEAYSWWLFLGFLPVHIAYPFPALRVAGVLPDSWATQYAVLIGTVIEIPLLLYILHRRAKDFNENRARLRVLDSTDPLTGLVITPVLRLRLRDALRRGRRAGSRCAVLLVELANHAEIASRMGREAGDRALVVAASRLSSVVREVDTVCRIENARFAVLLEGPQPDEARRKLAQHVVARGLEPVMQLAPDLTLRFRVVSAWAPEESVRADASVEESVLMERLNFALDQLLDEPRKVVHHLESFDMVPDSTAPATV
jgi:diguanylate cyclase (GGDEF)-like protein